MTASPSPGSGQHGAWNQPQPAAGWSPPAGVGGGYGDSGPAGGGYPNPQYGGYPDPQYGGGYPPPGGYAAPAYPPPQRGTNGFAIAALVLGIIGVSLLGFIFGFVALSQTKRTGQGGRGLAIAGLILSAMWTIGYVLIAVLALSSAAHRDPTGTVTQGGEISATALKVGDCVNNLKDSNDVLSLPGVPCAKAHEGEVFAVFDLPEGDYPGQAAVDEQVSTQCNSRLTAYSPSAQDNPAIGLFSVYPLEQNWVRGDREVVCIATAKSGTTTGSIKGT